MRKLFSKIHLWLSLPVGIIISVICLTGAILVFEQDITQALNPKLYHVEAVPGSVALTPSRLAEQIRNQVTDSLQLTSLQFSRNPEKPVWAAFKSTGRKTLSVNPYTGEVNGWSKSYPFFQQVRKLHRWLLDAPAQKGEKSAGKVIVGITTLAMVIILVSGLIIWIPRNSKALKNRLKICCNKGWRRFWYDSHVATGIYTLVFLLVMALTGLTWSFGWYRNAAYSLFGASPQATEKGNGNSGNTHPATTNGNRDRHDKPVDTEAYHSPYHTWDNALSALKQIYPTYTTIKLERNTAQIVTSPEGRLRKTDTATFHPEYGTVTSITTSSQIPASQKIKGYFYSFHTGTWGGVWTKTLYFLAAFLGGILPLSGYYLWYRKRRK